MSRHVILDLEMCSVPKGDRRRAFGHTHELIQIGAVLLDESLEVCDTFQSFVHPEFGYIDNFIEKLTGITPHDVAKAPCAAEALQGFLDWLPADAVIVSWSMSDRSQIIRELEGKSIDLPGLEPYLDRWEDCQATFSERMNTSRCYNLTEAMGLVEIFYEDGAHDALVDARNTAKLFAKMEREPDLKVSSWIVEEPVRLYTPFASLLANYAFA